MSPEPGADERRIRHYLTRLTARPFGHQDPAMTEPAPEPRPITPTRIIPAGAPLPARAPEPGELPPWWQKPPAPPAAPPPPAPVVSRPAPPPPQVIHHIHEILLAVPEPEPEPPLWARVWDWLWDRLVTWQMLIAVLLALTPWIAGDSPVGVWSDTVHQARTEAGILAAYIVAGVALAAAWALDRHTGRAIPRFLLVTAAVGSLGVFDWWDPFLLITGVHK